jgi:hypothetical protein
MSSIALRIDSELYERAKASADLHHRTTPEQLAHWAWLGQLLEATLSVSSVGKVKAISRETDLSKLLSRADTEQGKAKVRASLEKTSTPKYSSVPGSPDLVVQHTADGKKTIGRFAKGKFIAGS